MNTFFLTLTVFLLVIFGMALGYIVKRREIKGSCGGMAALGVERVCDCERPCEKRRQQLAKEAAKQRD